MNGVHQFSLAILTSLPWSDPLGGWLSWGTIGLVGWMAGAATVGTLLNLLQRSAAKPMPMPLPDETMHEERRDAA